MSYEIRILVNGNNCRQYHHNGKIFIEAKDGSEYSIEIKNNAWQRIFACCSVDGLNIIDGKTATDDGPGYVINGYSSNRYDGFRISDTQVAKFVFGKKENSYAKNKSDGSERNVGVIGIRLFSELIKPINYIVSSSYSCHSNYGTALPPNWHEQNPTIWCDSAGAVSDCCLYDNSNIKCSTTNTTVNTTTTINHTLLKEAIADAKAVRATALANDKSADPSVFGYAPPLRSINEETFDMGTKFGSAKESKVVEVEFEKGILVLSTDIFYASRQSLIDIGVPISNEKQVNFPSAFAESKYAKPPKNWNG